MKTIGLAAVYDKDNFGSMLQTYATQVAIERLGYRCEILDKSLLGGAIGAGRNRYLISQAANPSYLRAKYRIVLLKLLSKIKPSFLAEYKKRGQAFRTFAKKHLRFSAPAKNFAELGSMCKGYTAVVVGSDQLWLPINIAGDFYTLTFVPDDVPKVSYATSFGVAELTRREEQVAKCFLSRIQHLSVREESGHKLIFALTGREAEVVCDPTLLLTCDEWDTLKNPDYHQSTPYMLCYFMGNNPSQREYARRLAEKSGLRIVVIRHMDGYLGIDEHFGDECPYGAGPADFLSLLEGSDVIVTDSFHATLFSILYHRPFITFPRFVGMKYSTNSRLSTLLVRLGLSDRYVTTPPEQLLPAMPAEIDYLAVDAAILAFREQSLAFLASALKGEAADDR